MRPGGAISKRRAAEYELKETVTIRNMKCLLVSDLHYSLKQFDWVTDVAPSFDVVVIAGDHLDISGFLYSEGI